MWVDILKKLLGDSGGQTEVRAQELHAVEGIRGLKGE